VSESIEADNLADAVVGARESDGPRIDFPTLSMATRYLGRRLRAIIEAIGFAVPPLRGPDRNGPRLRSVPYQMSVGHLELCWTIERCAR
jgi:hypothetical protein